MKTPDERRAANREAVRRYRLRVKARGGIAPPKSLREHFEEKVEPCPMTGCWLWAGGASVRYGAIWTGTQNELAHRVAWRLYRGPIPEGMHVCHRCDVPLCVNPDHLFLGTDADNMQDCVRKGRQARGERHGRAKLTDEQVRAIRERYAAGDVSQRGLAREYGVAKSTISEIQLGESRRTDGGEARRRP